MLLGFCPSGRPVGYSTLNRWAIVQGVSNARDLNNAMEFLVVKVKQAMNVGVCSVYLDDAKRERYLLMAQTA